jgi:alkylhydroperoxidase family enzyme
MSEGNACRVALLPLEASRKAAEEAGIPANFAELNIFRALLQRPAIAKALCDLLLANFGSSLDHRLRELVIMRLGWATGSDYEWTQHWSIAQERFGCSEKDLLEARDWQGSAHFGATERAVLAATDETIATGALSAETFSSCEALLGDSTLDLVSAIGTWRLVSQVLRSLEVPLEDGVASWPPDGTPPPEVLS